jgi:hypothetical protein
MSTCSILCIYHNNSFVAA